MDFVERIFHISPDHGSGLFEVAIVLAAVVPIAVTVVRTVSNRRAKEHAAIDLVQKIS